MNLNAWVCKSMLLTSQSSVQYEGILEDALRERERERDGTPLDAEFNNVDSSKPWQNHL